MPPCDDPLARLHGRAAFNNILRAYWDRQPPPRPTHLRPKISATHVGAFSVFLQVF